MPTPAANILDPDLVRHIPQGRGRCRRCHADRLSTSISVGCRLQGKVETLERSEIEAISRTCGVFVGKKQAMVSATDRSKDTLAETVARAVAMAKAAPEDEFCGLADPEEITKTWPKFVRWPTIAKPRCAEKLLAQVKMAEEAAFAAKGVTNSEGAGADAGRRRIRSDASVASNGFSGHLPPYGL